MSRLAPSATVALTDKAKALCALGRDIVTMSAGEPDFVTPRPIVEAAERALGDGETHYVASRGIAPLRQGLFDKLREVNSIPLEDPAQILVLPGAKAGLMYACLALLDEGDECVCPEPAWVSYRECVSFAGARYVPVPTSGRDGFTVDCGELARAITDRTRLVILNTPANPTGKVWTRSEMEALADVLRDRKGVFVLADEIYEDLVYDGAEHVSFASLPGMAGRTLTLNGFSKAYAMTGWRLGYIAGPRAIIDEMLKIQQHSATCAVSFVQHAGVAALAHGAPHVAEMVRTFAGRRKRLLDGLSSVPGLKASAPDGTFYLFADLSAWNIPSFELADRLLDEVGLAVTPGAAFGESGEGHVRISFAASDEAIGQCCSRLAEFAGRIGMG